LRPQFARAGNDRWGGIAGSAVAESTDQLLAEQAVLTRWPALSKATLINARKSGKIAWVRGKRGSAWYRASAIEDFIKKELEQPCHEQGPDRYSNSAANGSPKNLDAPATIVSGMSPDMEKMEELVALASAQRILRRPKGSSPK
jgi:hypothetical protein